MPIAQPVRRTSGRRTRSLNSVHAGTWEVGAEIESIYRNAPVGLCVLDAQLRFVRVNRRLAEINGIPPEAHIGRTVKEIVPKIAPIAEPFMRKVIRTGRPVIDIELSGETASQPGVIRTWLETWLPLKDPAGRVIGLNVVVKEITQRKVTENRLLRKNQILEGIHQILQGTLTCGTEEQLGLACISVAQRIIGGRGFFINDPASHPARVGLPDGHPPLQCFLGVPMRHGGKRIGMIALANKPGGFKSEDLDALEALAPTIVQALMAKRAEQARRLSDERYRTLFNSISEGFCVIEVIFDAQKRPVDYRIVEMNPACERHTGLTNAIGKTARQLVPGLERDWIEIYGRIAATGQPRRFVKESPAMGRWFEVDAFRTGKAEHRRVGILFSDITERKRRETALRKFTATLEREVSERTRLAESRAIQLQALAIELIETEEKERQRIAGLLHDDLQQLLASAYMLLEASRGAPKNAQLEKIESLLLESSNKARNLSHEISPYALRRNDLVLAIESLVHEMRDKFGLAVQLTTSRAKLPKDASSNAFVFRAVKELLFNVAKHSGVKKAFVTVYSSGGRLVVCVADRGRGFDPDAAKPVGRTGGIGIATLRERASFMGGTFSVESTPGKGSRFTLTLPLRKIRATEVKTNGRPKGSRGDGKAGHGSGSRRSRRT